MSQELANILSYVVVSILGLLYWVGIKKRPFEFIVIYLLLTIIGLIMVVSGVTIGIK